MAEETKNTAVETKEDYTNTAKKKVTLWQRFRHNIPALIASIILIVMFVMVFGANLFAKYDPVIADLYNRLSPPGTMGKVDGVEASHILGTDQLGRDLFSRVLHGGQASIRVGFFVTAIGAVIGIILGTCAGYFGGWTDMIIMRLVDVWASAPTLLIAMTFVMIMGAGERNLIIALSIASWTLFCRMARSQALILRTSAMVESGQAIGATTVQILSRHVIPNILSPLVTTTVLEAAHFINAEANLSFLGFGVQPPETSWGLIIGEGRKYMTKASWLVIYPGIMIAVTVLCLNLLGDWLRDEFDPLSVKY